MLQNKINVFRTILFGAVKSTIRNVKPVCILYIYTKGYTLGNIIQEAFNDWGYL